MKPKILNKISHYIAILALLLIAAACSESPIGQMPVDNIAPGIVSDVKVTNIAGGAYFTYTLPNDDDLLYIKANYKLNDNGHVLTSKASIYVDTLWIEGYGTTDERTVDIVSVDRSNNESTPITVTINPETPPVHKVLQSIRIVEDFGGIKFWWTNETQANICLNLLMKNKYGDYESVDEIYTKRRSGEGDFLGLPPEPEEFAMFITDRWGNYSDTIKQTLTPIFEMQVPFKDIKPYNMLGDTPEAYGWKLENLWDGKIKESQGGGFHTDTYSGPWPHRFTFKVMPGKLKSNRIKMFQRDGDWFYRHGNVKQFELWASNNPNIDGSDSGWVKIDDYKSFKPSGLPGTEKNSEDIDYAAKGESFYIPAEFESFQYFRVKVTRSWDGSPRFHIMEVELYGNPEWEVEK